MQSTTTNLRPAFHVVIKPIGAACNLSCRYCFYREHTALYPGSALRMSDEVLEAYITQVLTRAGPHAQFIWQGGEPTLAGRAFFERVVALQERLRPPDVKVHNALQTNGILLNDDWCGWLADHDFLVGVSLDGPCEVHDANRVDRRNRPSFEQVRSGIAALQRHDIAFTVLTAVSAANVNRGAQVYQLLRDEVQAKFIQFIPIVVQRPDGTFTPESITGEQYGDFLCAVFDLWVQTDIGQVFVQHFDAALAAWSGEPQPLCVFEEECGNCPALEHNGDLYACDHYVQPDRLLGNLLDQPLEELMALPKQLAFGRAKRTQLSDGCRECRWRFACNGGCPKNRFVGPDLRTPQNHLCAGYRKFFTHIDPAMITLSRGLDYGVAPSDYMTLLAVERGEKPPSVLGTAKNDPCPCFGARKFKRCHGERPRKPQST